MSQVIMDIATGCAPAYDSYTARSRAASAAGVVNAGPLKSKLMASLFPSPEGSTILDAAKKLGIDTPTLCFLGEPHPRQRLPCLCGGAGRLARTRSRLLA